MNEDLLWRSTEIAAATDGRARGAWSVAGVAIDSRTVTPGELFVALVGPRHDGHDYVVNALRRGAAALVHRRPPDLDARAPVVEVHDTFEALERLGAAGRARANARIAGVTGSVGKTGTKEALRYVLAAQGPTHASAASYNNHWGVPLSLARMPQRSAYAIFELGMNAPGEIDRLGRMIRPHVALITAIAPAHLGRFASLEAIAEAKAEIFSGLQPEGCAILNLDSPCHDLLAARARAMGCRRVIGFGAASEAHARLVQAAEDGDGSDVTMELGGRRLHYRIGAPGRHWVQNSLAVLAVVEALGADPVLAAGSLGSFQPPEGRGRRLELPWPGGRITLIDDSYNANPASMRAALGVLAHAPGRKVAVLGDMLELGARGPELHAGLEPAIEQAGADLVFSAGRLMGFLHERLPHGRRGAHAGDAGQLWSGLEKELRAGDTVLVKGSLGSRMGTVVEAMRAAAAAHAAGSEGA